MTYRVFPYAGKVDLAAIKPSDIDFRDISEGMAKIDRFGGQGSAFVSLAEHTVYVVQIMGQLVDDHDNPQRMMQLALIHDMHEPIMGNDIITPLKRFIAKSAGWDVVQLCADIIDNAIFQAAGIDAIKPSEKALLNFADQAAAYYEAKYLKMIDVSDFGFLDDAANLVDTLVREEQLFPCSGPGALNALVAVYLPKLFETGDSA